MIKEYLYVFGLSILPISELRGAIPAGFLLNLNIYLVLTFALIGNILVIPITYFFLENIHHLFHDKWKFYRKIFDKYLERKRKKLERHIGTKWESIALMFFVGIPLPITGAYTGTLLAWFFKLNKKQSYAALVFGILISSIIVTTLTVLGIKLF